MPSKHLGSIQFLIGFDPSRACCLALLTGLVYMLIGTPWHVTHAQHRLGMEEMDEEATDTQPLQMNLRTNAVDEAPELLYPTSSTKTLPNELLDFDSYLKRVERHHPSLTMAELDRQIAQAKRVEKQGAFDPSFNSTSTFNRFNSTSAVGSPQEAFETKSAVEFLTRQGTKVSLGYMLSDGDIKTPVKPTGEGGEPYFALTIPLIRGAFVNPKSTAEKQAFVYEEQASYEYYLKRLTLLLKATSVYWKWTAAVQQLDVEQDLLELAKQRRDFVERRAKAGDVAEIDIVEAEQELQKRQGRLVKAQRDLQEATLNLALFQWDVSGKPLPAAQPQQAPATMPEAPAVEVAVLKEAKYQSLLNRPEFSILNTNVAIAKLDKRQAFNELLPQLDAIVEPGYELGAQGIEGTYRLGGKLSVPLRRRTARGQLDQAKFKLEKLSAQERLLIQQVFVQIEDVYSQLTTLVGRIEAAKTEVDMAEAMAKGERARYSLGDSTLFVVNRRERSVAESQIKLLKLMADYQVALVALKAASGTL